MNKGQALIREEDTMVKCLYEHKPAHKSFDHDSSDFWASVRQLRHKQLHAIERIDENGKHGLLHLVEALLSADNNCVFSPATLYCSLVGLAGVCAGNTRQEILNAVFCENDQMQNINAAVRESVTGDSGSAYFSMGSSLWLNSKIHPKETRLLQLCETLMIDAFVGEMGTLDMDVSIQKWTNANTGNMLKGQVRGIRTASDTAMEMLTTSYFGAKWSCEFSERRTFRGDFHINDHTAVRCSYMKDTEDTDCYQGNRFTAVCKSLGWGLSMWFILPDRGVSIAELIEDGSAPRFLADPSAFKLEEYSVTMCIPKFDIASRMDLRSAMQTMGIYSIFDHEAADFSEITDAPDIFLSKVDHVTRVKVTEEGVEAASLVEMGVACACLPPELKKIEFTLDRPFLFAVSKDDKVPMYVGTVIDPSRSG